MQEIPSLEYDFALAAVSVIPAAIVWIFSDTLIYGLALGTMIFLAIEYGYPTLRKGKVDLSPVLRVFASIRDAIRSQVTKRA